MVRNSGFHYTLPYTLTVKNLLRVYPRIPVYCLIHWPLKVDYTSSGNRLWRPANMCRRSTNVGSLRHAPFTNSEKLHRVKN